MAKKNRVSGEGHVRWRDDGLCEARLLIPMELRPALGGRRYLYFYDRKEEVALAKREKAQAELLTGGFAFDAEGLTFGGYLRRWLRDSVRGSVAE